MSISTTTYTTALSDVMAGVLDLLASGDALFNEGDVLTSLNYTIAASTAFSTSSVTTLVAELNSAGEDALISWLGTSDPAVISGVSDIMAGIQFFEDNLAIQGTVVSQLYEAALAGATAATSAAFGLIPQAVVSGLQASGYTAYAAASETLAVGDVLLAIQKFETADAVLAYDAIIGKLESMGLISSSGAASMISALTDVSDALNSSSILSLSSDVLSTGMTDISSGISAIGDALFAQASAVSAGVSIATDIAVISAAVSSSNVLTAISSSLDVAGQIAAVAAGEIGVIGNSLVAASYFTRDEAISLYEAGNEDLLKLLEASGVGVTDSFTAYLNSSTESLQAANDSALLSNTHLKSGVDDIQAGVAGIGNGLIAAGDAIDALGSLSFSTAANDIYAMLVDFRDSIDYLTSDDAVSVYVDAASDILELAQESGADNAVQDAINASLASFIANESADAAALQASSDAAFADAISTMGDVAALLSFTSLTSSSSVTSSSTDALTQLLTGITDLVNAGTDLTSAVEGIISGDYAGSVGYVTSMLSEINAATEILSSDSVASLFTMSETELLATVATWAENSSASSTSSLYSAFLGLGTAVSQAA